MSSKKATALKRNDAIKNGLTWFVLFAAFTLAVCFVDRKPIGPEESVVGLAAVNGWFHNLTGYNRIIKLVSDIAGYLVLLAALMISFFGFIRIVTGRISKGGRRDTIALIIYGVILVLLYIVTDKFLPINYRPVILDGELEYSYPSSHTMLSVSLTLVFIKLIKKYIRKEYAGMLKVLAGAMGLIVICCRTLCGVHWLSDIIGAFLLSMALVHVFDILRFSRD